MLFFSFMHVTQLHLPGSLTKRSLISFLLASLLFCMVSCSKKQNTSTSSLSQQQPPSHQPLPLQSIQSLNDFEVSCTKAGCTGSGGAVLMKHKTTGEDYILKKDGTDDWVEAYASTVYRFLVGSNHAQEVSFILEEDPAHPGKKIIMAAVRLEKTFQDAWKVYEGCRISGTSPPPFLPPGSGLGKILVASYLLLEADLKGLSSNGSGLGLIHRDGKDWFFKIDSAQSFRFNDYSSGPTVISLIDRWPIPLQARLDLTFLADLKKIETWGYLEPLRLTKLEVDKTTAPPTVTLDSASSRLKIGSGYFEEIQEAAKEIAHKDSTQFRELLDFCESQFHQMHDTAKIIEDHLGIPSHLSTSAHQGVLEYFNAGFLLPSGVKTHGNPGGYTDPTSYKEAILWRWNELRAVFGLPRG